MLREGQAIDRYEVEAIIGRGGTSVVYRVRHRQLGSRHALKVLSATSPIIRERLILEGQLQAALKHPNVVSVSDVIDADGMPGLLMEYIEGPTLEHALQQYRLYLSDAEVLFRGILAGVRHAHAHGLVHRDLKPANVLLSSTPDGFVPKVTDFGLAKVLQGEFELPSATRTGTAMGTPHYMAPEQIRDARHVDQRADIFSLGCILYELVTGERTFPGEDALTVYNRVVAGQYIDPRELIAELPDRIESAIVGALALEAEQRIPNAIMLEKVFIGEVSWNAVTPENTAELEVTDRIRRRPEQPLPVSRAGMAELDTTVHEEVSPVHRQSTGRWQRWIALAVASLLVISFFPVLGLLLFLSIPSRENPRPVDEPALQPAPSLPVQVDFPPPAVALTPTKKVEIEKQPHKPVDEVLAGPPQVVRLLSVPTNAAVQIDQQDFQPTPRKMELLPGAHQVSLRSGDDDAQFTLTVVVGAINKWCYLFDEQRLIEGNCPR